MACLLSKHAMKNSLIAWTFLTAFFDLESVFCVIYLPSSRDFNGYFISFTIDWQCLSFNIKSLGSERGCSNHFFLTSLNGLLTSACTVGNPCYRRGCSFGEDSWPWSKCSSFGLLLVRKPCLKARIPLMLITSLRNVCLLVFKFVTFSFSSLFGVSVLGFYWQPELLFGVSISFTSLPNSSECDSSV